VTGVADVWLEIEDVERETIEFTLLDRTYAQLPPRAQALLGWGMLARQEGGRTDFTELVYTNGRRKAQLLPIIGHVSKMTYGWAVSEHADTELELLAWEQVKKTWRRLDIPYAGMIVHHDQDAVFTGYEWARRLVLEDIEVANERMRYYNNEERRHLSIGYLPPLTFIDRGILLRILRCND